MLRLFIEVPLAWKLDGESCLMVRADAVAVAWFTVET